MERKDDFVFNFGRTAHLLRNAEHQEYVSQIMKGAEASVLAVGDTELTALWNKFKKYGIIEELLRRQPKSAEETEIITVLNARRTDILLYILSTLHHTIKRSTHAEDVEWAKHLSFLSEAYKKTAGKNIVSKSADIRKFVQTVKQEPYATYANGLNLMRTFLILEAANMEVESNYELRALLWLEKEKYGTLSQLRKLEDEAMRKVADMLEFLYRVNEREAKDEAMRARLEAIFTTWNANTEQFVRVLAHRGTRVTLKKS